MARLVGYCIGLSLVAFHSATYLLWAYERRVHQRGAAAYPLARALALWLGELLAIAAVLLTWPLGFLPVFREPTGGGRPVLLLHGWAMTPASMLPLALRLRRRGRNVCLFGYNSLGPDMYGKARRLAGRIRELASSSPDGRIDVVAHSLGGLIVRAAAVRAGAGRHLASLVTLGTPHQGTALAAFLPWPNLAPMRPGSAFIQGLATSESLAGSARCTAIFSTFDALVFPHELAEYPGAVNVEIDGVGHLGLLFSAKVAALVAENLAEEGLSGRSP